MIVPCCVMPCSLVFKYLRFGINRFILLEVMGKSLRSYGGKRQRLWGRASKGMGKSLRGYGEEPQKLWGRASEVMGKSLGSYGEEPQKLWGRASEIMGKSLLISYGESLRGYGEEPKKVWGRASEVMGKSLRSYGEEPQKLWGRASGQHRSLCQIGRPMNRRNGGKENCGDIRCDVCQRTIFF